MCVDERCTLCLSFTFVSSFFFLGLVVRWYQLETVLKVSVLTKLFRAVTSLTHAHRCVGLCNPTGHLATSVRLMYLLVLRVALRYSDGMRA
jgi:hypothetical protein